VASAGAATACVGTDASVDDVGALDADAGVSTLTAEVESALCGGAVEASRFSEKSTPASEAPHAQRARSGGFSRSQTGQ